MYIKQVFHRIRFFLLTANLQILIAVPILIGFCCLALCLVVAPTYTGAPAQNILICFGALSWAMSGVPKIVRQESVYGPIYLSGPPAFFDGIVTILANLILASLPIIIMIRQTPH